MNYLFPCLLYPLYAGQTSLLEPHEASKIDEIATTIMPALRLTDEKILLVLIKLGFFGVVC